MTDDAPVIFKRKQPKLSQSSRTRPAEDSATAGPEDGVIEESVDSPAAVASRFRKQQKARRIQKPQLSFGGDDEVRVSGSPKEPILTFLRVWGRSRTEMVKYSKSKNLTSAKESLSLKSAHLLRTLNSAPMP